MMIYKIRKNNGLYLSLGELSIGGRAKFAELEESTNFNSLQDLFSSINYLIQYLYLNVDELLLCEIVSYSEVDAVDFVYHLDMLKQPVEQA